MTESADRQIIDTGTDQLLCHVEDGVGVVTLNRPEARNALSDVLTPALRAVLPELAVRRDVGCILLTGAGQAFCAGGDVKTFGAWRYLAPRPAPGCPLRSPAICGSPRNARS